MNSIRAMVTTRSSPFSPSPVLVRHCPGSQVSAKTRSNFLRLVKGSNMNSLIGLNFSFQPCGYMHPLIGEM